VTVRGQVVGWTECTGHTMKKMQEKVAAGKHLEQLRKSWRTTLKLTLESCNEDARWAERLIILYFVIRTVDISCFVTTRRICLECRGSFNIGCTYLGIFETYHDHYHHHRHQMACMLLGLATCSGPTSSQEVFWRLVLGFVSHTVGIS